ncbi:alpha/beta hydrolase family protein [Thalictrum thalictroides]|uniref:Alpha/beta hydrolase family protein n=1 Tax=Thalictrum thalictroides TaxID=46969 RepID=A0A7J6X8X3_THATH|nr:alpha/beta hydrolase family protein [Thalictrum thalictroides]
MIIDCNRMHSLLAVLSFSGAGKGHPVLQLGAKFLCVSDLLLLGSATIEETQSLLHWLDIEAGFGKAGVCGLSMGGVYAAMVESLHPTPFSTLPFLSPHSAVVAFCEGILIHATAWDFSKILRSLYLLAPCDGYIPKHSVLELQRLARFKSEMGDRFILNF